MGGKSMCTLVKTPDVKILIDPGISIMQKSFPASMDDKLHWLADGEEAVKSASKNVDVIIISHYHFDHFTPENLEIYKGKTLLVKNPNEYINHSQRRRAFEFHTKICKHFGKDKLECDVNNKLSSQKSTKTEEKNVNKFTQRYNNPLDKLPIAMSMDFGDYNKRRKQLLDEGLKRFYQMSKKWIRSPKIPELNFQDIEIRFADGKEFTFGQTRIKFTNALFHGLEFAVVGWIIGTLIQFKRTKLIHTSDINGPVIEDYVDWILKQKPTYLVIDGPSTYQFGHVVNRINMTRAVNNMTKIIKESKSKVIIYDHHLLREAKYIEHTQPAWKVVDDLGKKVLTAAEYLGQELKVLS
jgi:predicted metallo-beta-lactamase superfamily hydrolase